MDETNKDAVVPQTPPATPASEPVAPATPAVVPDETVTITTKELDKLLSDNENYRRATLMAKGKIPPSVAPQTPEVAVDVQQMARDLQEVKVALANKAQVGSPLSSGGSPSPDVPVQNYYSKEQLEAINSKGLNPEFVKKFEQDPSKPTTLAEYRASKIKK